jgi:putative NIF3 family GTP cyclohydrolase 1 type 2
MEIRELYCLAIAMGIKADLRGEEAVLTGLKLKGIRYKKSGLKKDEFDIESLVNPYADTRILFSSGKQIKSLLAGIDIEGAELLAARQLGVDAVFGHHPKGVGKAGLAEIMRVQCQILAYYGVPFKEAAQIMGPRILELERQLSPLNQQREADMARLLRLDFMCIHTPADNLGAKFLHDLIQAEEKSLKQVGDLVALLKTIPEYEMATKLKMPPLLFTGNLKNPCGKIAITGFAGGTEGSKEAYDKLDKAKVRTIISMHMSDGHRKEAEKIEFFNVLIAGHMASDSLGINLILDEYEKRGIEVIPTSGLIRVKRFLRKI